MTIETVTAPVEPVVEVQTEAVAEVETVTEPVVTEPTSTSESQKESQSSSDDINSVLGGSQEEPVVEESGEVEEHEYELELAEDSPLSDDDLEAIAVRAENLNLSEEEAKDLIANEESRYSQGYSKHQDALKKYSDDMRSELLADAAFNTDAARTESLEKINNVLDTFGSEDLSKFMKTNAGNNLSLAKFFLSISDAMGSDTVEGKGKNQIQTAQKSRAEQMYPDLFKGE